ncbi:hypothetical protein ANANG_G00095630 [Anguilla anguilla]|uniref:Transforming acidic coiled-coil-containing protein C-terminal domain-containing protein n=1 Tax=Anguilla anguilla TaxID=7936 RepID=A0A9D3S2T4_ANGAN|nr:hypothetical protein ANANG_G00095630 [Anguilla anguilla]
MVILAHWKTFHTAPVPDGEHAVQKHAKGQGLFSDAQRHPVTKKIMSPSNRQNSGVTDSSDLFQSLAKQMASLEIKGSPVMEKPKPGSCDIGKAESPFSNDMVIQTKGGYQLDFDNLEALNPFKSSNLMGNSPVKIPNPADLQTTVQGKAQDPFKSSSLVGNSPAKTPVPEELQTSLQSEPQAKTTAGSAPQTPEQREVMDPFKASDRMVNSPVNTQTSAGFQATVQSEAMDPFTASNLMTNSPVKTPIPPEVQATVQVEAQDPFKGSDLMVNSPLKTQISAELQTAPHSDGIDPFNLASLMTNSPVKTPTPTDLQTTLPSEPQAEITASIAPQTPVQHEVMDPFKACSQIVNSPVKTQTPGEHRTPVQCETMGAFKASNLMVNSPVNIRTPVQCEAMDAFKASNMMVNSPVKPLVSAVPQTTGQGGALTDCADEQPGTAVEAAGPLDETLPFSEHSLADLSTEVRSTESTVIIDLKQMGEVSQSEAGLEDVAEMLDPKQDGLFSGNISQPVETPPVTPRGAYNFDFDNLDSVNPFQTGGSKLQNSPVINKPQPSNAPPAIPEVPKEMDVGKESVLPESKPTALTPNVQTPKASYSFDFSPFGMDSEMESAPKSRTKSIPSLTGNVQVETSVQDDIGAEIALDNTPVQKDNAKEVLPRVGDVAPVNMDLVIPATEEKTLLEKSTSVSVDVPECPAIPEPIPESIPEPIPEPILESIPEPIPRQPIPESIPEPIPRQPIPESIPEPIPRQPIPESIPEPIPRQPMWQTPEIPVRLGPAENSQNSLAATEEEFVPGATFMSADFGQIDYLEQFGSTMFKESALRKQSLYLKFDPLVKESPKKPAACTTDAHHVPLPPSFASRLEKQAGGAKPKEASSSEKPDAFFLLEGFAAPAAAPFVPSSSSTFDSLVPALPKPAGEEAAIIEVLMYSQSDLDAVIAKVKAEAKERDEEWKAKFDKLTQDNKEMGNIMADFEATVSQVIADSKKQKAEAQKELQKVVQEKEQVTMDLNAMERSFSELFRRLEKYKEVIEGYKKNEDILKKCAQDYLARIKQEEQRYQTLKVHAEEKISLANDEIAQVRSKLKAETSALQAQLRREQLKVCSLEKSLEQKAKETEELTKLCDDLIANVQKR